MVAVIAIIRSAAEPATVLEAALAAIPEKAMPRRATKTLTIAIAAAIAGADITEIGTDRTNEEPVAPQGDVAAEERIEGLLPWETR
jgi:hypothetical protein